MIFIYPRSASTACASADGASARPVSRFSRYWTAQISAAGSDQAGGGASGAQQAVHRGRPGASSAQAAPAPSIAAVTGLVVEDSAGDFCGAVVGCEKDVVTLADRHGKRRVFPLAGTFLLEGQRVSLVRPVPEHVGGPTRTASGSIAAPPTRAKVAKASRIFVEGKHDAELVEHVWGDDLRDSASSWSSSTALTTCRNRG